MKIRDQVKEFKYRWPAIRSILRDGTVIYKANILGITDLNRDNSIIIGSYFQIPAGNYGVTLNRSNIIIQNSVFKGESNSTLLKKIGV